MRLWHRLSDWCVPDKALHYERHETHWRRVVGGPLAGMVGQFQGSHLCVPVLTRDGLSTVVYAYTHDGLAVMTEPDTWTDRLHPR